MLTAEQIEIRKTGIGASESSMLFEMHPKRSAIDLYLEKAGLAEKADNDNESDGEEITTADVGNVLEDGMRLLFERKTGKTLVRPGPITLRHPLVESVLASPDDFVNGENAGVEIKVVGWRMAHHWESDTLPDYVRLQAAQNMAVCDRDRWYVIALIGGTTPVFHTVERDLDLELAILERIDWFLTEHVVPRVPPPITDPEARRRYLRTRYPGSGKNACRKVGNDPLVVGLMRELAAAKEAKDAATETAKRIENDLIELVGDDYGVECDAGKFIVLRNAGAIAWKEIAMDITRGIVPRELIDKHRGAGYVTPRFTPKGAKS